MVIIGIRHTRTDTKAWQAIILRFHIEYGKHAKRYISVCIKNQYVVTASYNGRCKKYTGMNLPTCRLGFHSFWKQLKILWLSPFCYFQDQKLYRCEATVRNFRYHQYWFIIMNSKIFHAVDMFLSFPILYENYHNTLTLSIFLSLVLPWAIDAPPSSNNWLWGRVCVCVKGKAVPVP